MATRLTRSVARTVALGAPVGVARGALVVTLHPGNPETGAPALIEMREPGRRASSGFSLPVATVYRIAAERAVAARKASRNPRRTSLLTGRSR